MVTQKERAIYEKVLERDRLVVWWKTMEQSGIPGPWVTLDLWMSRDPWVCVAPIIDPNQSGRCSGAMERDHVHSHTGGTKGKRPLTTMETLVILCRHHHQDGWATAHRPEIRKYIAEANEAYENLRVLPDRR